ncbi:uncharacterized protein LOC133911352 isoform X2 [Phragmites australis]|uniref:uncharacterized protein LOC133911352 isoform X2 n=1 Tax=Phragmites australis TaxID=29695 RepID=UPI002D77D96A|nr:uncharacterized protein LOC133911352 isoform X2 [Phragmites australis]
MGKRSQRRPMRRQENNIGCMSGLIRMFYFRQDAKLLLDRKQGSRRHTFSGFAGRGHSRKKSRDFEEIDEDLDNMEECRSRKPTVKRLMEDELRKVKQLKITNDEVQRILADLRHGVCLDKSSMQNSKSKGDQNHNTSITVTSPSGSLDPSGSKCMKEAEENELQLALADFLGQIHSCHDEWPHKNCKNKNELCTELRSIIQTKLDELNSPCSLAYEQTPQNEESEIAGGKHLCSSREAQPKKFRDALEMLSSDTELLLKILQKPNSHILESIQRHQNKQIGTNLEPTKTPENAESVEDTKSPNQDELSTKTRGKESRHIFFWKKERSNRKHTTEGTNSSQPVNKIVILKPNPRRGIDPTTATSSTQAPELSANENSKFSIKDVRRRFRIVTSEARKGRPSVYEDNLQRDPYWLKNSAFTIKKGTRLLAEQASEGEASPTAKKNVRPSTSSRPKQRNDGPGEINSDIITSSKGVSVFYDEAKKHLTEILKDKSQTAKYPTLQISRSLVRMLSLPQCSTPSPRSSPKEKDCIDLSPEEANICAIYKAKREKFAKEESQSGEISKSVACGPSEALHEQAVEESHCIKEESQVTTQDGELDTVHTEEINKLGCSEKMSNAWCIPEERCRYNSTLNVVEEAEPGKEHVWMFPSSHENVVEKPEYQEPATPRSSDLHKDILRSQYTSDDGLDQGIFWEDKDVRLGYIKALLELSELCTYQNLEVWYIEDELISPCLFEELHQGDQIDDTKLLFDCICEAVTEIQSTYFRSPPCLSSLKHNIRAPPMEQNLISEINKHVERHLHYQFPSTLDQLVSMDLKDGSWMDLRSESEEITVVIWDFILDDILDEVAYNLWI